MSHSLCCLSYLRALFAGLWIVLAGPVLAADAMKTTLVSVRSISTATSATLSAPAREAINFSGQAVVKSRLSADVTFNNPQLVMTIDMSNVVGVGSTSGARYVVSSTESLIAPHAANQVVEFVFPLMIAGTSEVDRSRTGLARFAFNVDMASGTIMSAAATLKSR